MKAGVAAGADTSNSGVRHVPSLFGALDVRHDGAGRPALRVLRRDVGVPLLAARWVFGLLLAACGSGIGPAVYSNTC